MKRYSFKIIAAIIGGVFIICLILYLIPALSNLELKTIDWRFQFRGPLKIEQSPIVIVAIDDQSYESMPDRWPFPRYYYANVIENLTAVGAKVIGLDIILDKPDSLREESEERLVEAIDSSKRVVLAGKVEDTGQYRSYPILVKPISKFMRPDAKWGITAIQSDPDGMHRQYFVVQNYEDDLLPSFGLQILRRYLDIPDSESIQIEENKIRIGNLVIPLSLEGLMRINFTGPAGTFPKYTFDSVIDDERFDLGDFDLDYFSTSLSMTDIFQDKIVLIGSTVSELHDNFPTPFFEFKDREGKYRKAEMPGVEIHANAIWTILNKLYFTDVSPLLSLLFLVILIIIVYMLVLRLSTKWSVVMIIVVLIGYNLLQFFLFSQSRLIMEMVIPTLGMAISFVAATIHQYVITQHEKRLILGAFERYVPQKVVKELITHPEKLKLGGEERFLTVLFMDLANFTTVTEDLKPTELVSVINAYLTEMTEIVFKYDGIIDKYEGDALMAEFGAPVFYEDHATKACYAALEMMRRLRSINFSHYAKNVTRLDGRIGINSGTMIVGNMGSKNVFDYTVMGDSVNLASRLEGANKNYKTQIMISEDTYKLVKEAIISRPLDKLRVKGRQKPVIVFEVIGRRDSRNPDNLISMVSVFTTGYRYYLNREWKKAAECFAFCLEHVPEDGASELYLNRVKEYEKNPPPDDWDGVFTMKTK